MSASPVSPVERIRPRFTIAEWLSLRRHAHPEYVESLDSLPPSLAALTQGALLPGDAVQGALIAPAEYFSRKVLMWEYVPERALIFLPDAALYLIAEGPDQPAKAMRIDASALLAVRSSLLLLYGLLEFKADCGLGVEEARLEYNTVVWGRLYQAFARLVDSACRAPRIPLTDAAALAANESLLATLPFKFANGLRYYALAPGEAALAAVFQPAIWRKGPFLLRRQVTPNTLLALTDRKVVLIEENRSQSWSNPAAGKQSEYGWIFTYIPLDRVVDMSVAPNSGLRDVTIKLEWGAASDTRGLTLELDVAGKWLKAWEADVERL